VIQLVMTNLHQEFGDLTLDESLVAREKNRRQSATGAEQHPENYQSVFTILFHLRRQGHD
jgi:hypothetical protein